MKKTIVLLFTTIFLTSCIQHPSNQLTTSARKNFSKTHLVSKANTSEKQPTTIESEEIRDLDLPQPSTSSNDEKPQIKDGLSQSTVVKTKDKSTTTVEDIPRKISPDPNPSTTPENTSPTDLELKPKEPPAPPTLACPNALYDVNQPCDWIPPNLRPVDEQGSSVPLFTTSQEAWNWGDAQMMDQSSKWYMCGYNRMDGHTNDGTPFYYAYMKSCPTE